MIEQIPANRLHVTSTNLDPALPDHYKEKIEQLPGVASVMISTEISAYYREPQNLLYIAAVGGEAHLDVFGDIPDAQRHTNALRAMRTGAVIDPVCNAAVANAVDQRFQGSEAATSRRLSVIFSVICSTAPST